MIRKAFNIVRLQMSVFVFIFCSIFLLESRCSVLDDDGFELSSELTEVQAKATLKNIGSINREFSPVAFTAVLTHDVTLGPHQTIEYDKVISNVGNGYDPRHGHFTAPLKGIYIVSATTCSDSATPVHTEIVVNGVQVAAMYGDDYDLGGHTLTITLEETDMVWVRHFDETTAIVHSGADRYYSSFSVALITPF